MTSALMHQVYLRARTRKIRKIELQGIKAGAIVEREYRRLLLQIVKDLIAATDKSLLEKLSNSQGKFIADAANDGRINAFLNRIKGAAPPLDRVEFIANIVVEKQSTVNREKTIRMFERTVGINVRSLFREDAVKGVLKSEVIPRNVSLIKSISEQYHDKVELAIRQWQTGELDQPLTDRLEELEDITRRRAGLIARDQIAKVNLAVTQARQTALGITEYIWQTSEDERVRETHDDNNGLTFRWDSPPATGHPGEDILCRCIAIPVLNVEGLDDAS